MALFPPRFAVLVCLCAALPLALPNAVEAAHIHGHRPVDKHSSSHHGSHRTRTVASRPTGFYNHDDKNKDDGHEHKQDHRSSNLPPLLRRYRVPNREEVYEYRAQELHEGADHNVPKSAFARSRYRRGPALHSRRSSIYVPGEHGNNYVVAGAQDGFEDSQAGVRFSDGPSRRQLNEGDPASGRIDIVGSVQSPGQRLASLTVDNTPINWSSGQSSAMAFQLNASTSNQTQFIILPIDDATGGQTKHVTLATEVFDADSAEMAMYCATYDSDPGSTSPLLMTPCTGVAQSAAIADDTADSSSCDAANASSSNSRQSQIFSYDPLSGKLEPVSASTSVSDLASCVGAIVRRDGTTSSSVSGSTRSASSTLASAAPAASALQQAERVTLVYVAGAPEVPASTASANAAAAFNVTSTARASNGQVAVLTTTTTLTTTVVATVTDAPDVSSRTVSPARAAVTVSVLPPSTPSESTTIPSGTSSAAQSAFRLVSTPSVTASSSVPENAESLEVEIVGISTPSVTSSSSTTASSSTTSVPLDAEAVASSITNEMPHRRRAVAQVNASVVRRCT